MIASGCPVRLGVFLLLPGFGDEVGRGGHVYELLHVPMGRFCEIGLLVEVTGPSRDIAHLQIPQAGQVGVHVGAIRVPEVDVGVDHPVDLRCHRVLLRHDCEPGG